MKTNFESKFSRSGIGECWNWLSGCDGHGYGAFLVCGKQEMAHRFSYQFYIGEIPEGKCVLHRCDNPKCVNPNHLWIGTKGQNNTDRSNKGRNAKNVQFQDRKGERNARAKLTNEDVINIRKSHLNGVKCAEFYGVTHALIYAIRKRKIWKHI